MKKLLLVLLVVALASFLFVGCLPTTPAEGEGEGEGEAEICPTVAVTSQVAVGGKTYIKAGTQTITVTFAVPTEPVSVYVGAALKDNPVGVPSDAEEVVLYTADGGLTYTGTVLFAGDCDEAYIYVLTCDTCAPCKYPYTVDGVGPYASIAVDIDDCTCAGCELTFRSTTTTDVCAGDTVNCGDACSGFASWSIDIYDNDPFDVCCLVPCETPDASDSGVCPISFSTACLTTTLEPAFVVITLVDEVGNETKYFAKVSFNPDTCDTISVVQYKPNALGCTDWNEQVDTPDVVAGKVL